MSTIDSVNESLEDGDVSGELPQAESAGSNIARHSKRVVAFFMIHTSHSFILTDCDKTSFFNEIAQWSLQGLPNWHTEIHYLLQYRTMNRLHT